uniref:Uncharacterized protein n=1 Tax=Clandestinovirus TaxID=2831644 RepID=A0A8F8KM79_9VIRU|nr:hypothetical protein KOM_12_464 [Clandestinovirus]
MSNGNLDVALNALNRIRTTLQTMDATDPKRKGLLDELANIQAKVEAKKFAEMGKLDTRTKRIAYKPVAANLEDEFYQNVQRVNAIESEFIAYAVQEERYKIMLEETRVISKELDKVEDLLRVLLSIKPTIDGTTTKWTDEDIEYVNMANQIIQKAITFPGVKVDDGAVRAMKAGMRLREYLRKNGLMDSRQVEQLTVQQLPGSVVQVLAYIWDNQPIPKSAISNTEDVVHLFRKRVSENVVFASPESPNGQSLQTIFKVDEFATGKLDSQIVPFGGLDKAFKVVALTSGVNVVNIDLDNKNPKVGVHTYLSSGGKGKYVYLVKNEDEWFIMSRCPGKTSFKCETVLDKPLFV